MRRWVKRGAVAASVVAVIMGLGFAYYHHRYPYGWSHSCAKILAFALLRYADEHHGWFPRGETTPEASLSLLYLQEPALAYTLRGKTTPESVVLARLEGGELLTSETCGWHYVEGLRKDDDPRLALFWDKVGLGHFGERLSRGGHHVCFVTGPMSIEYISGERWDHFLAEQEQLRAQLKREP
jgi:hypothetical protein